MKVRLRQLKDYSQLDIPYIPNNYENLPNPKDFEYAVAGSRLDVYKEINNKDVQLHIIWMDHELHRVFQVNALVLNTKKWL